MSGNHVRVEAASAQALGKLKFKGLVALADTYIGHLHNPKLVAVAQEFIIDKPVNGFSTELDAHGLSLALSVGMPDNIEALGAALVRHKGQYSVDSLRELLAAKDQSGVPALCLGMRRPETGAIKAYGQLLTLAKDSLGLPPGEVVALLGAQTEGHPALALSMRRDWPDAIKSFAGVLQSLSLPRDDVLALLSPRMPSGGLALTDAFLRGGSNVVTAYAEALGRSGLAADDVVALLASGIEGSRGLVHSLKHNGPEAVRAVGAAVSRLGLPADAAADIYASKDANGTPILHDLLEHNQLGSIDDLRAVYRALDPPADTLAILLAGKDAIGVPALHSAMREGHADAVRAFGKLLLASADKLDAGQMSELLAATDPMGSTGVRAASSRGHTGAVEAFHEVWGEMMNRSPNVPLGRA